MLELKVPVKTAVSKPLLSRQDGKVRLLLRPPDTSLFCVGVAVGSSAERLWLVGDFVLATVCPPLARAVLVPRATWVAELCDPLPVGEPVCDSTKNEY